jgi:hypothetical protein
MIMKMYLLERRTLRAGVPDLEALRHRIRLILHIIVAVVDHLLHTVTIGLAAAEPTLHRLPPTTVEAATGDLRLTVVRIMKDFEWDLLQCEVGCLHILITDRRCDVPLFLRGNHCHLTTHTINNEKTFGHQLQQLLFADLGKSRRKRKPRRKRPMLPLQMTMAARIRIMGIRLAS